MLRIGIIDDYLDNWHCSNFPRFMRETIYRYGYDAAITGAFALRDAPQGVTSARWGVERNIPITHDMQSLIDQSDALMVIAADDAACHESLSELALKSGKPTFVDKTFAPDLASGRRMFALADACGTPVFSSSAQRYCQSILDWQAAHSERPVFVSTVGPHSLDRYAVHQLEPIMALMGPGVKRLKAFSAGSMVTHLILDWGGGRWASFMQTPQPWAEFNFMVSPDGETGQRLVSDDATFYHNLMKAMLDFFAHGIQPVPHRETLEILAIIDTARAARNAPDVWFDVPSGGAS